MALAPKGHTAYPVCEMALPQQVLEADPESVGLSSARLDYVSRWAAGLVQTGVIPGAMTMVARHGKVVHFSMHGSMDVEAGKPMAADAIFRIFSMTKPIVSLALMTLYEEAHFQLDDPASRYLPELRGMRVFDGGTADQPRLRDPAREMTVRDLLMHTSGMPGLFDLLPPHLQQTPVPLTPVQELYRRADIRTLRTDGETLAGFAAKVGRTPLQVDPGSKWIYGLSTDLVGYLCEVLAGQPLDVFLQERILGPLGMVDTAFDVPESNISRLAACYRLGAPGEPPYVLLDTPATSPWTHKQTFFSGVAGLVSTIGDYMRFAKMLANGGELDGRRVIGPRTLQLMASNHLPGGVDIRSMAFGGGPAPAGVGFGLGFGVLLDPTVNQTLGTPGEFYWGGAASTSFFVSPRDGLVAMFMTQLLNGLPHQFPRFLRVLTCQALLDQDRS